MSSGQSIGLETAGSKETPALTQEQLQDFLTGQVAAMAGIDQAQVDLDRAFAYYGLDSAQMLELTGRLSDVLHQGLPDSIAWEQPTIRRLSAYLAGNPMDDEELATDFAGE